MAKKVLASVVPTTSVAASTGISVAATTSMKTECPYRQAMALQQALVSAKMRVGFFLGAGCPVSIRVDRDGKNEPLIPDIAGLTKQVCDRLSEDVKAGKLKGCDGHLTTINKHLCDNGTPRPTIEDILSHIRQVLAVVGNGDFNGLKESDLHILDAEICRLTTEIVSKRLPNAATPYHQLATWIRSVERTHPVEVFTPNYDLLMEQAFEERKVPFFDGFVGSDRTFFDLLSMEQDKLPSRWARVWKVHGSINWWRTPEGDIERRPSNTSDANARQMIYPSHLKYDQSRRLPYLAMIDRLRSFLGSGQVVLVTNGYSFIDQHLNEVLMQGLRGNPNAVCYGLVYGDRANALLAVERAKKHANLRLLAADGCVVGTVERAWDDAEKPEHPLNKIAVTCDKLPDYRSTSAAGRPKCLLGDFVAFGSFLANQMGTSRDEAEVTDA